jgi:ABC-2 type transport system permease protein
MLPLRDQLTGLLTIIVYTFRKIILSRRIVITLLIAAFVGAVALYGAGQDVKRLEDGTNLLDSLILFFFMPVLAMIYGSSLLRDEMDDRSITQVVTSPLDRLVIYTGYYLGLVVSVSAIMLIVLTAGFFAFFGRLGIDGDALGVYGGMAGLMIIGALVYSALFMAVSVILDRPIYFGLIYAFIWEAFIGSIPGRIGTLAVKHYIRSIGRVWIRFGDISRFDGATSAGASAWVLLVLTVALFAFGAYMFREKEFA